MCLISSMLFKNALAKDSEPCEPTIISRGYFSAPSNGVYSCTIRKNKNGIITAWMWSDNSIILSDDRFLTKYGFQCESRLVQKLKDEYLDSSEEVWSRPQKDTTADKWLTYICKKAKFY